VRALPSERGATAAFCEGLLGLWERPLPAPVEREASRSLLNTLGVAVGGSRHEAVEILLAVAPRPQDGAATVPGRPERLDPYYAAMATGLAAHLDDFDDTHLETVVHPGAAALSAVLAVGPQASASGPAALLAFALACEAQLRVAAAITPWNFDAGWQVTGTVGGIGAAAGAALLLGLDATAMANALGIAASETLGLRVAHGTMIKASHPGKAAANGVLAALLARRGFTGPTLEAPRGYFEVLSGEWVPGRLGDELGVRWELSLNTYKPYPGGIVSHPAIDAAIALAAQLPDPGAIESILVRCHPLVPELTADPAPADPLRARFSTPHAVAVGLLDGEVGVAQLEAERLVDPAVVRLRDLVELRPGPGCERDEAEIEVGLADGSSRTHHVEHARGGLARPLTDAELAHKVETLVEPVLPGRAPDLIGAVADLPGAASLDGILAAVTPADADRGAA
jgi:2-methylcitrate dehydratase PrpD